jgi:hypothetical protein
MIRSELVEFGDRIAVIRCVCTENLNPSVAVMKSAQKSV